MIAALRRLDQRWRLVVCGEGDLRGALEERVRDLGVADAVEFRGYVPHDAGLAEAYRAAHALAHVTWTEGLPQILYEAFAARLPVIATDVGGIREAVGDAAILVAPGDPQGIAEGLALVGRDAAVRDESGGAGPRGGGRPHSRNRERTSGGIHSRRNRLTR